MDQGHKYKSLNYKTLGWKHGSKHLWPWITVSVFYFFFKI